MLVISILANSANTDCCPFHVKITCSKFKIDELQQRCHKTLLVSLLVTLRNLLFGVFLPKNIIRILRKITINFRKVSLKGVPFRKSSRIFWQNPLKVPVKRLNL